MIAFFFTIPMSSTMPMIETTLRSSPEEHQRQHRADARRRQRRDDRQRMNQALVENAEHDVDGEERGHDQHRLGAERLLVGQQRAREEAPHGGRRAELRLHLLDPQRGVAQRHARTRG